VVSGVKGCREVKTTETGIFFVNLCDEMIVNVRESCFSGMVFTVGRLMRIEETV